MSTLIFGAGGHALDVLMIARRAGTVPLRATSTYFVVADASSHLRDGLPFPVITEPDLRGLDDGEEHVGLVAVGSSSARGGIVRALGDMGIAVAFPNLVDPAAVVAHHIAAMQPRGLVAFPFSLVSDRVVTGEHCHVNTGAVVGHEVTLGDYVTISPRAVLCGRVTVGDGCFLGAGSTVIDGVTLAPGTVVGAGAVVVRDTLVPGIYVGVPARRLEASDSPA